jgi:hypothetical protein
VSRHRLAPGQMGQTPFAALSQTVNTKSILGASGLANSSQLLLLNNVGWAVCLAEAIGRDSLSVRRGNEQIKIGAGFFVNVSELATRNHRLSELFADLQARLMSPAPPGVKG